MSWFTVNPKPAHECDSTKLLVSPLNNWGKCSKLRKIVMRVFLLIENKSLAVVAVVEPVKVNKEARFCTVGKDYTFFEVELEDIMYFEFIKRLSRPKTVELLTDNEVDNLFSGSNNLNEFYDSLHISQHDRGL